MNRKLTVTLFVVLLSILIGGVAAAQEPPVVHAVLFHSPTCPHCHTVIEDVLPPLQAQYGSQLQIALVDVTQQDGQAVFQEALTAYQLSESRRGVPMLVLGDRVMVGSAEIPAQLPALIEQGIANGGVAWPTTPLLDTYIAKLDGDFSQATTGQSATVGLAVATLAVLVTTIGYAGWRVQSFRPNWDTLPAINSPTLPILAIGGISISAYLTYTKLTASSIACAGVGSCDAVQASPYSSLFGIPVALIGVLGYLLILLLWYAQTRVTARQPQISRLLAVAIGISVLFSIYLTLLEIFVIDAVCLWCVASALITAVMMFMTARAIAVPQRQRRNRAQRQRMRGA